MVRYRKARGEESRRGAVPIGDLLARYRARLRPPQGIVIATFCDVVADELGITLAKSNVRYNAHTRTLSLTVRGPQRSEIILQKKRLLAECAQTLGEQSVPKHIV